ncbi:SDR family oxidoreductase [Amycolatopsis orientalis]|uniref:SDR family oxidoreductase n=1 Tax=Amycolatopsis orientalis TaxID=31958 RepID=UPI00039D21DC|nr:SDR family oxidoreductase [Amycolatopsis orientalis]
MIVITGATGALNGATVEHLLKRVPAGEVGVSVREVAKARHFAERGVRVRQGSYEDPKALRKSFEGAEKVLLVSSNDPRADGVGLHRAGIEAAVEAGAQRIVYTSHQNSRMDTPFPPGPDHAATERILAGCGVAWTALRNGFYAHSIGWLLGNWREDGVIKAPVDGPVSWTERADVAEAAAVILAGDQAFDGPVTLTAPQAVTFDDVAELASRASGKKVERAVVADDEWIAGEPEEVARMKLTFFQAARQGHFAGTSPLLAELLGREPRGITL